MNVRGFYGGGGGFDGFEVRGGVAEEVSGGFEAAVDAEVVGTEKELRLGFLFGNEGLGLPERCGSSGDGFTPLRPLISPPPPKNRRPFSFSIPHNSFIATTTILPTK